MKDIYLSSGWYKSEKIYPDIISALGRAILFPDTQIVIALENWEQTMDIIKGIINQSDILKEEVETIQDDYILFKNGSAVKVAKTEATRGNMTNYCCLNENVK